MLDRHDADIMVETAACKYFCSEEGWNVIDSAMQIMGGEGYVTENEFERLWRDNRIHRIVEGSNEVMQSFIFAYGGKQLAEHMLGVLNTVQWDDEETLGENNVTRILSGAFKPATVKAGTPLATEIFLGKRVAGPGSDARPPVAAVVRRPPGRPRPHAHARVQAGLEADGGGDRDRTGHAGAPGRQRDADVRLVVRLVEARPA